MTCAIAWATPAPDNPEVNTATARRRNPELTATRKSRHCSMWEWPFQQDPDDLLEDPLNCGN